MHKHDPGLPEYLNLQKREILGLLNAIDARQNQARSLTTRNGNDVIKVGLRFLDIKERLGDREEFNKWTIEEIGLRSRQSWEYMKIAKKFGASGIPDEVLAKIQLAAMEILAAECTSPEIIERTLELAEQGTYITTKTIQALKGEYPNAKPAPPPEGRLPRSLLGQLKKLWREYPEELVMDKLRKVEEELKRETRVKKRSLLKCP